MSARASSTRAYLEELELELEPLPEDELLPLLLLLLLLLLSLSLSLFRPAVLQMAHTTAQQYLLASAP
jgi:hypothetical protein